MFNKDKKKMKADISEIQKILRGVDIYPNTFETPASYSALAELERLKKERYKYHEVLYMLLDELGYTVEEGMRLTKQNKAKKK